MASLPTMNKALMCLARSAAQGGAGRGSGQGGRRRTSCGSKEEVHPVSSDHRHGCGGLGVLHERKQCLLHLLASLLSA